MMTEYTILETIVLGFDNFSESTDVIFNPGKGHLKFDGSDIYFVTETGKEHKSHTTNNAIELWLKQGKIEVKK
jgi:hypothetical protein